MSEELFQYINADSINKAYDLTPNAFVVIEDENKTGYLSFATKEDYDKWRDNQYVKMW